MKTPELRDRKTASLRMLTAISAALMTSVLSSLAQEPSVAEAKSSKLPANNIIATLNVGFAGTQGLVVAPNNDILYDGANGQADVLQINVADPQDPVIENYVSTSEGSVTNVAITPDGNTLYAVQYIYPPWVEGSVAVITNASSSNPAYLETISGLGEEPGGIAVNPKGTQVWITDFGSASINIIDTANNTLLPYQLQAGNGPSGLAFTPNGKYVYVANFDDNTVVVIDTATQLLVGSPINVGTSPQSVVMNPKGTEVYVGNQDGTVSVIDTKTNKVTATINTNSANNHAYVGMAITPNGKYLYVDAQSSQEVVMVSTATNEIVGTAIAMPNFPSFIAIAPNGEDAYIAANDEILVVNITTK